MIRSHRCELARQMFHSRRTVLANPVPSNRFFVIENTEYIELTLDRFLKARNHLKAYCEEYTLRIDNEQDQYDRLAVEYGEVCAILDELEPIYRELNDPEVTDRVESIATIRHCWRRNGTRSRDD